ncbi:hypothetical protein Tco_0534046 [Tanacetum coccineum]
MHFPGYDLRVLGWFTWTSDRGDKENTWSAHRGCITGCLDMLVGLAFAGAWPGKVVPRRAVLVPWPRWALS